MSNELAKESLDEGLVVFNKRKITKEQLQEEVEKVKTESGSKIVEVKPGVFKKKLED